MVSRVKCSSAGTKQKLPVSRMLWRGAVEEGMRKEERKGGREGKLTYLIAIKCKLGYVAIYGKAVGLKHGGDGLVCVSSSALSAER